MNVIGGGGLNHKYIKQIATLINKGEGMSTKVTVIIIMFSTILANGFYLLVPHAFVCDPNRPPELRSFELGYFSQSCMVESNTIALIPEFVVNAPIFALVVVIVTSRALTLFCIVSNNPSASYEKNTVKLQSTFLDLINDDESNEGIIWTILNIHLIESLESFLNALILSAFAVFYARYVESFSFDKQFNCNDTKYPTILKSTGGDFSCENLSGGLMKMLYKAELGVIIIVDALAIINGGLSITVFYNTIGKKTANYLLRVGMSGHAYVEKVVSAKATFAVKKKKDTKKLTIEISKSEIDTLSHPSSGFLG